MWRGVERSRTTPSWHREIPVASTDAAGPGVRSVTPEGLRILVPFPATWEEARAALLASYVRAVIRKADGNCTEAARAAGITREGLYKMRLKSGVFLPKRRRELRDAIAE
jgi:DNA-binding NtrC family response regulator